MSTTACFIAVAAISVLKTGEKKTQNNCHIHSIIDGWAICIRTHTHAATALAHGKDNKLIVCVLCMTLCACITLSEFIFNPFWCHLETSLSANENNSE